MDGLIINLNDGYSNSCSTCAGSCPFACFLHSVTCICIAMGPRELPCREDGSVQRKVVMVAEILCMISLERYS